jgi:Spy/CpxP family protein refolding chaperone
MLYMAQLEDKIKNEVQSRENLTSTYQSSLNKGVGQLNVETQALAENPLIKEISLLVAQQLIQKQEVDPKFQSMLTPQQQMQLQSLQTQIPSTGPQQNQAQQPMMMN